MTSSLVMPNLPPTGWSFYLQVSDEISGERGQQVRIKQLGPDLWAARYEANQLLTPQVRRLKAILHGVLMQRETFFGWDPHGVFPSADPGGLKLLAPHVVKINSLNADFQRMSIKGLPAHYVLTRGDYLSFEYAGGARALHQLWNMETVTANVAGTTSEFGVTPRIRPGASIDAAVVLIRAPAQMMIVPGSLSVTEGPRFASIAFDAIQVLP